MTMPTEEKLLKRLPIHYYVTGDRDLPCLVFLHSAFADHRAFDWQLLYFSKEYRVVTIDLLGHGRSQNITTKEGIDETAKHIKELMDIEEVHKAHFVGVSIGALLAQDFANRYPDKVDSMMAVGGYDINNYDEEIARQSAKQQGAFMMKALLSIKWFSRSNARVSTITPAAQNDFYEMNRAFKRRSFRYMTKLGGIMNRYKTNARNYPLMILCGESDNPLARTLAEQWHRAEPASKFLILEKAGHCANMDNPHGFNAALLAFLKGAVKQES